MSMRQMSKMVGISNPYLSQIERGLRAPSASVTAAIATSLGITVEELYERSGIDPEPGKDPSELRRAIERSPELSPTQRASMIEIYESFINVNRALQMDQAEELAPSPD